MEALAPRYSKEEFARRGDEIYARTIRPQIKTDDNGKFVVIDIETGDFEIDRDELAASDRLLARRSGAQIWVTRIGSRYARRLGPRYRVESAWSWELLTSIAKLSAVLSDAGQVVKKN